MHPNPSETWSLFKIGLYLPLAINIFTLGIGTIGSIGNFITLTSSQLRQSASIFYLLCTSLCQLISILFIVPTRIALDNGGEFNLERQSLIFCKIRYYFILTLPELATSYLLLAILDRCLATSNQARFRQWSQLKIAHRLSIVIVIIGPLRNIHMIIFYTIYNGNCQPMPDSSYALFMTVYSLIIVIIVPHTVMFILLIITLSHLRQAKRRIFPISLVMTNHFHFHRIESQIISIIIINVLITSLISLLRIGSYVYMTLTSTDTNKTPDERAAENFAVQLGVALYYLSFAISFYVSILTSKTFRCIFYKRLKTLLHY